MLAAPNKNTPELYVHSILLKFVQFCSSFPPSQNRYSGVMNPTSIVHSHAFSAQSAYVWFLVYLASLLAILKNPPLEIVFL